MCRSRVPATSDNHNAVDPAEHCDECEKYSPTYTPLPQASLWGPTDGNGASLVYYFALPEGWTPEQESNKAALGLLQRLVHDGREADRTPTRDRLKLLARIANVDEWAERGPLSSYVSSKAHHPQYTLSLATFQSHPCSCLPFSSSPSPKLFSVLLLLKTASGLDSYR